MWKKKRLELYADDEAEMDRFDNPEELIRCYHEAVLHPTLPNIRSEFVESVERMPAAGLLVRLASDGTCNEVRFAWADMKRIVMLEHDKRRVKMIQDSLKNFEEDDAVWEEPGTADSRPADMVRGDIVHDIFFTNARPPTELDASETPVWLVPLLHRWYRLHDLGATALKHCPTFPGLSPLMMEADLTMPSTGRKALPFDAYRALGMKVLGLLTTLTAHARMPCSHQQQFLLKRVEMLPRDRLA
jgi:hypothetical protein